MRVTKDGWREIVAVTVLCGVGAALGLWLLHWAVAAACAALWVFGVAFFRDPERPIPSERDGLVSPADGTVTELAELDGHPIVGGPALRIGIFLSIFNVHINRSPCDARVVGCEHKPGRFLNAMRAASGTENESNTVTLDAEAPKLGRIVVRQVSGLVARRIVCHCAPGDRLRRGQRFGMIKFGSRTELIVPRTDSVRPAVTIGEKVRAGQTILVRIEAISGVESAETPREDTAHAHPASVESR